jgi:hypothetical protein
VHGDSDSTKLAGDRTEAQRSSTLDLDQPESVSHGATNYEAQNTFVDALMTDRRTVSSRLRGD